MDRGTGVFDISKPTGSFGRASSGGSSIKGRSLSLSSVGPVQVDNDEDIEVVSEAGDIGDRALNSNRWSGSGSFRMSVDNSMENGAVAENALLHSYGLWSRNPTASNSISPVSPLPEEIMSPLPTDPMVCPQDKKQEDREVLPRSFEYISSLIHLAVFGILGVLTRYLLQKLFGPGVAGATSDQSFIYLDLPSNMVGSFLMGWVGVVFKGDIARVSEYLAIGLSTGYLGSLTTFSGWNQKMLDLAVDGRWFLSFLGFFVGLFLVVASIVFGIETARGFKWLVAWPESSSRGNASISCKQWRLNSYKGHMSVTVVLILVLCLLWGISVSQVAKEFNIDSSGAQLWLACLVGPPGVWIRWFLARLNGRGLGKAGSMKWVPFGTLIANVSAACIMAALATVKKAVNTRSCNTVASAIQFGLLGCLSTVSTFMAEINAMRRSNQLRKAYAYATLTIVVSFGLGILLFSVPVWVKGYK